MQTQPGMFRCRPAEMRSTTSCQDYFQSANDTRLMQRALCKHTSHLTRQRGGHERYNHVRFHSESIKSDARWYV